MGVPSLLGKDKTQFAFSALRGQPANCTSLGFESLPRDRLRVTRHGHTSKLMESSSLFNGMRRTRYPLHKT